MVRKRGRPVGKVAVRNDRVLRAMFAAGATWGQMNRALGLNRRQLMERLEAMWSEEEKARPKTPDEEYLISVNDLRGDR